MLKNQRFAVYLGILAGACSIGLIGWAIVGPVVQRNHCEGLVDTADDALSPPIETRVDIDAVDCDRADLLLREALDLDPHHGRARRLAPLASGCAALRRGDFILAEGALRSASVSLVGDPRPNRWLGSLYILIDRPREAEDRFLRALEIDEHHLPSLLGLSDAQAELARTEEALELLTTLDAPPMALVELRKGMLFEELGRNADAERAYNRAIELSPERAEPINNLAALERERGNLARAWELQQQAIELSPDDPVLLLNAGLLAITLGHDERAEEVLERAVELEHDSANPARALADHLLVRGQVERSLEVLGPAIDRFPRDAALRNSLGNAYAAAGRVEEARVAYRRSCEHDAELAEPHNGLAALLLSQGDLTGAREELQQAIRLDPDNVQAHQNLEVLQRRLRELERTERDGRIARASHEDREK